MKWHGLLVASALALCALAVSPHAEEPAAAAPAGAAPGAAPAAASKLETAPEKAAETKAEAKPESKSKDYVVLKLGKEDIRLADVETAWKDLFPGDKAPDFGSFNETVQLNVLKGMVTERLVYREAVAAGFDKSEEVKKRLAALEKQLVMQAFIEKQSKTLVSPDALKASYAERTASMKDEEEIRAAHILVEKEDDAKAILKDLRKGGDFAKVAKEKSIDKNSGAQGGDLGWFTRELMVPEFSEAAFKLKKGEISAPVKTSFGWHIIRLDDRRKVEIPSFEEMQDELEAEAGQKAVQQYIEGLLKKAEIKYYTAEGKEKPFPRTLDAKP